MAKVVGRAPRLETAIKGIVDHLFACQRTEEGPLKGAFFSKYALHHPLNDFKAGGAHHPEVAALAAWAFSFLGRKWGEEELLGRAELALDWAVSKQTEEGCFYEIQNLDLPARWFEDELEHDKPFPCSTISTAKVAFGLSQAVRKGAPGKDEYLRSLRRFVDWLISMEYPPGSGSFAPREGTPVDCLYANALVAQAIASAARLEGETCGEPPRDWLEALRRAVEHNTSLQDESGMFPYLGGGGRTVAYTAAVAWCLQNVGQLAGEVGGAGEAVERACRFLTSKVDPETGALDLSDESTNMAMLTVPYFATYSVLKRFGEEEVAGKVLRFALENFWNPRRRLPSVALPVGRGGIYECAQFQVEILLYLLTAEWGGEAV